MRGRRATASALDKILRFEATEAELLAWYMRGVLERTGGNQCEAERVLEIARTTIRRRLARMSKDPEPDPEK